MRWMLALLLLLGPSTGSASPPEVIQLDLQLSIDGELVSQPKILTLSGQKASIESVSKRGRGVFIEVTPTLQAGDQVEMAFTVASVKKGHKTVLSEPRIVTLLGREAQITQGSDDSSSKPLSLAVTPTRAK